MRSRVAPGDFDESCCGDALPLNCTHPAEFANDTERSEADIPGWGAMPGCRIVAFDECSAAGQAMSSALDGSCTLCMDVGRPKPVKFAGGESNTLFLLFADIESCSDQRAAKFIPGERSPDSFGAFVQGLDEGGLAQQKESYQDGLRPLVANRLV